MNQKLKDGGSGAPGTKGTTPVPAVSRPASTGMKHSADSSKPEPEVQPKPRERSDITAPRGPLPPGMIPYDDLAATHDVHPDDDPDVPDGIPTTVEVPEPTEPRAPSLARPTVLATRDERDTDPRTGDVTPQASASRLPSNVRASDGATISDGIISVEVELPSSDADAPAPMLPLSSFARSEVRAQPPADPAEEATDQAPKAPRALGFREPLPPEHAFPPEETPSSRAPREPTSVVRPRQQRGGPARIDHTFYEQVTHNLRLLSSVEPPVVNRAIFDIVRLIRDQPQGRSYVQEELLKGLADATTKETVSPFLRCLEIIGDTGALDHIFTYSERHQHYTSLVRQFRLSAGVIQRRIGKENGISLWNTASITTSVLTGLSCAGAFITASFGMVGATIAFVVPAFLFGGLVGRSYLTYMENLPQPRNLDKGHK